MKKIAFYTLGCKVNQADTASMEGLFRRAGYEIVDFTAPADVYVVNTCVVTNEGQRKSRQIISRAVRRTPPALVVVTGCYPQAAPQEARALAGVDIIIGNQERGRIVELVEAALAHKHAAMLDNVRSMDAAAGFEELAAGTLEGRTRAFLKIQEGCNQYCTYCIIPYARGPLRSRSLEGIRRETARLVAAGCREIVLLGIHLGCYGRENGGGPRLADAVAAALSVRGLRRLRLGSLESAEVDDALLALMQEDGRLCRHLHLPLQAGCDKILRAMGRPYTAGHFASLLARIRGRVPGIAVTTDVIAGFPGETEADFAETVEFVRSCGFAALHVFPYSRRADTPAAAMPGQVSGAVKARRAAELGKVGQDLHRAFLLAQVGTQADVLFEQAVGSGCLEGLTGTYLRTVVPAPAAMRGSIARVRLTGVAGDSLKGELVPE